MTVAQVRQRVAAALEAASGWSESTVIGGAQWQNTGEGESAQSGHFAVTVPMTTGYDTSDGQLVLLQLPKFSSSYLPATALAVSSDD